MGLKLSASGGDQVFEPGQDIMADLVPADGTRLQDGVSVRVKARPTNEQSPREKLISIKRS